MKNPASFVRRRRRAPAGGGATSQCTRTNGTNTCRGSSRRLSSSAKPAHECAGQHKNTREKKKKDKPRFIESAEHCKHPLASCRILGIRMQDTGQKPIPALPRELCSTSLAALLLQQAVFTCTRSCSAPCATCLAHESADQERGDGDGAWGTSALLPAL